MLGGHYGELHCGVPEIAQIVSLIQLYHLAKSSSQPVIEVGGADVNVP